MSCFLGFSHIFCLSLHHSEYFLCEQLSEVWNWYSPPEVSVIILPEQLRFISTRPLRCCYCFEISLYWKYCLNLSSDNRWWSCFIPVCLCRVAWSRSPAGICKGRIWHPSGAGEPPTPVPQSPQGTSLTSHGWTRPMGIHISPLGFLALLIGHRLSLFDPLFFFPLFSLLDWRPQESGHDFNVTWHFPKNILSRSSLWRKQRGWIIEESGGAFWRIQINVSCCWNTCESDAEFICSLVEQQRLSVCESQDLFPCKCAAEELKTSGWIQKICKEIRFFFSFMTIL